MANGMPAGRFSGMIAYEGDLVSPIVSYASAAPYTPLVDRLSIPPSTAWTRSAVVQRAPRRNGLRYFYSHGGVEMPIGIPYPGGTDGRVSSSSFQRTLVTLHDWSQNDGWYSDANAYPRNLGTTFRTPQLKTQVTGGAGPGAMGQRPLFQRVQRVQRYSVVPQTYNTRSTNG